jgi:putative endonuclease
MQAATQKLGQSGEKIARRHLKKQGYRILAANYECAAGEIDLIGFREGCIVFFEVKSRASDAAAPPEENITPAKRRQMEKTARYWLAANRHPDCAYRFDAISVVIPPQGEPAIRHIVEAFTPAR